MIVLAVKVETLKLCSAYKIKDMSKALTISLSGTLLNIILKKFSAKDNLLLGDIIFFPFLALKKAATAVGALAKILIVFRILALGELSFVSLSSNAIKLTQVLIASMG